MTEDPDQPPPLLAAMHFTASWRDYQSRVLAEMDDHLADGRLHVVAAPGSGKTVLGLEAMRRIGRRAIVLSPTLTIRNQWRERLCPLFLPAIAPWRARISTDIAAPGDMTIATYQALHSAWSNGGEGPFAALAAAGPVTLVLDECHHLRREWWHALFALREAVPDLAIVALTATPPYDAGHAEWQRYEDLCGPIDTEIGVPELVRNGDLAPHQDHIRFSIPDQSLRDRLVRRREVVFSLMDEVAADTALHDLLLTHPFLIDPHSREGQILDHPEALSAMVVLLAHAARELPQQAVELIGADTGLIPPFSHQWFEPLLEHLINRPLDDWRIDPERRQRWLARLGEGGLVTNGRVSFGESVELARLLSGNTAKLPCIAEILRAERASLGDGLRMAVLTDHVRAAELPRHADAAYTPQRLGVVPIFETLRKTAIEPLLGVLSGSLVILPASAAEAARKAARHLGIDASAITLTPCPHDPAFLKLDLAGKAGGARVALVTALVGSGHVRVVVGTQALLGEGWDAPSINSLVLASNAGSFMLSNQMRGRAIRSDPAEPDKVANIWHLATIDADALAGEGADFALLERRFSMVDGVAEDGSPRIENGMERLAIASTATAAERNALTMARAADRAATRAHWRQSLGTGTARSRMLPVAETSGRQLTGGFQMRSSLQAAAVSALGGGVFAAGMAVRSVGEVAMVPIVLGALTFVFSAPGLVNAARLYLRNGTLERSLEQVGMVVLEGLDRAGILSTALESYRLRVVPGLTGQHAITIEGGTRADQNRFVESLIELLGPVQNPRYLLRRYGRTLGFEQEDFHAVPSLIGTRGDLADYFLARWQARIGQARVDFTRSAHGRRMLLKARAGSLAAGLRHPLQRRSMWL